MNIRLLRTIGFSVGWILLFSGCKDDGGSGTGGGIALGQAIAGTWVVTDSVSVTVPDNSIITPEQFGSFLLTITPSLNGVLYTTQGSASPIVFPSSGTLLVNQEDDFSSGAVVTRQPDMIPMTMTLMQDDLLQIVLSVEADSSVPADHSRQTKIEGEYTFNLVKQE